MKKTKIKRGVLIKYPKKKQDMRVDLPTIGLDTLKDCKKAVSTIDKMVKYLYYINGINI